MRLVNTHTLQLEEFWEGSIPSYAALSHRWTSEELNFKEVYKKRPDMNKTGYKKLIAACEKAADYDVEYLWIDTCCINKESSAELSEAINSMFSWYEKSEVCIAYLQDVRAGDEFDSTFRESVWFRRCWTLQELIAPRHVEFFDCSWTYIGSKISNAGIIQQVTGITNIVLKENWPISTCSIAERMSWASERIATRSEDIAYSLLGIFDINMPPLYGEGSKAFVRLQQEIIRHASDTTFLLWGQYNMLENINPRLLAHCPTDFSEAKNRRLRSSYLYTPMAVTNVGIEMTVELVRWSLHVYGIVIATGLKDNRLFALLVRKCVWFEAFHRIGVVELPKRGDFALRTERKLLVMWGREEQLNKRDVSRAIESPKYGFAIETDTPFPIGPVKSHHSFSPISSIDECIANEDQRCVKVDFGNPMDHMVVECKIGALSNLSIQLSFDFDSNPVAYIHNDNYLGPRQALDSTEYLSPYTKITRYSKITVTTNSRTGRILGSFGASEYSTSFDRIPKEFVTTDCELWISFINPIATFNNSPGWWTFRVSTQRPKIKTFQPERFIRSNVE